MKKFDPFWRGFLIALPIAALIGYGIGSVIW